MGGYRPQLKSERLFSSDLSIYPAEGAPVVILTLPFLSEDKRMDGKKLQKLVAHEAAL